MALLLVIAEAARQSDSNHPGTHLLTYRALVISGSGRRSSQPGFPAVHSVPSSHNSQMKRLWSGKREKSSELPQQPIPPGKPMDTTAGPAGFREQQDISLGGGSSLPYLDPMWIALM